MGRVKFTLPEGFAERAHVLSYRERRVLELRGEGRTHFEIGLVFNLSRERVAQLQRSGLLHLEDPTAPERALPWFRERISPPEYEAPIVRCPKPREGGETFFALAHLSLRDRHAVLLAARRRRGG